MFQDGSGGGPTDSPRTRGAPSVRVRLQRRGYGALRAVRRGRTPPQDPRRRDAALRPRPGDVSTSAGCNTERPPRGGSPGYLPTGLMTAAQSVVALAPGESAPCAPERQRVRFRDGLRCAPVPGRTRAEFPGTTLRIHPFASMRFHVLLNSLFKVLFNFPSRYLSAIGLAKVFSLRWSLPPALGCILKQPDSEEARRLQACRRYGPDTRCG